MKRLVRPRSPGAARELDRSKEETARLAEENRLMEVRLQELKLAMDKEKKARSSQSSGQGGHWQSASRDDKVSHPPEVLKKNIRQYEKPSPRANRPVRKVKVLKDEPLVLPPHPPSVTNDIKRIMKKDLPKESPKETSPKAKKCGQCEMKAAAVLCQDCGENYCPGCFASFHLKGALKKHRSVPIQALGLRQSPRTPFMPKPPPVSYHDKEPDLARISDKEPLAHLLDNREVENRKPKVHFEGPSLLDGEFDEQANAAEFAAALAAWRSGKAGGDPSPRASPRGQQRSPRVPPRDQVKSDQSTQSPRYSIEVKGTSTEDDSKPLKIEFHDSGLSYADKLLLRKHRRDPLESLVSNTPRYTPTTPSPPTGNTPTGIMVEESDSQEQIVSEAVDFQALYEVACLTPRSDVRSDASMTSQVQVCDVTGLDDVSSIEHVSSYQVEETPGCIEFVNEKNAKNDQISNKTAKSKNKDAKTNKKSARQEPEVRKSSAKLETGRKSVAKTEPETRKSSARAEAEGRKSSAKITTSPPKPAPNRPERTSSDLRKTWDKEASLSVEKLPHVETAQKPPINKNQKPDMKLDLKKEKPSPRPKSRATPRAGTPRSARPNSRQARALLRETLGEGVLTKKPSSGLSEVAARASTSLGEYRGMSDLLTLHVPQTGDRVIMARPTSARTEKRPQSSVSYKLYSMGPKSWRPDSALGDAVAPERISGHDYNFELGYPEEEVDDDVTQEIRALDVIGRLGLEFHNTNMPLATQSEVSLASGFQSEDGRITTAGRIDQSQPRGTPREQSDVHLRGSVQSDSSCEDALQRLAEIESPRVPPTDTETGRESRMIIVDGEDMTEYDHDKYMNPDHRPGVDDTNTLDQLEWELASMTGRITSEGKISRLSLHSSLASGSDSAVSSTGSSQNMDSAREIENALRNDALGLDELESQITDELEVRALD